MNRQLLSVLKLWQLLVLEFIFAASICTLTILFAGEFSHTSLRQGLFLSGTFLFVAEIIRQFEFNTRAPRLLQLRRNVPMDSDLAKLRAAITDVQKELRELKLITRPMVAHADSVSSLRRPETERGSTNEPLDQEVLLRVIKEATTPSVERHSSMIREELQLIEGRFRSHFLRERSELHSLLHQQHDLLNELQDTSRGLAESLATIEEKSLALQTEYTKWAERISAILDLLTEGAEVTHSLELPFEKSLQEPLEAYLAVLQGRKVRIPRSKLVKSHDFLDRWVTLSATRDVASDPSFLRIAEFLAEAASLGETAGYPEAWPSDSSPVIRKIRAILLLKLLAASSRRTIAGQDPSEEQIAKLLSFLRPLL